MNFWTAIAALAACAIFAAVYFQIVLPLWHLREALRRLSERDFRPVLMSAQLGFFRETAGRVRKISELLQQLDQQITDEGFSLRAILSSMVEGVLIADRSQRIRLVNEALHQMFDLRVSPINRTMMEVFFSHEIQQAIEQTLRTGEPRKIEISVPSPLGPNHPGKVFEVYAGGLNPRQMAGPVGVVVVFHDVTTIKNLEAIRKEFVANVSHEFRTPLAIINGYVETLLDGALDDRPMAEKSLQVMHKHGQRLTLLIEDLLAISRLEHRSPELDLQPVNVREILQRVQEHLEPAIAERKVEMTVDWHPDALIAVADARRLEQVFSNLLENAIRYGALTGARVTVSARRLGGEIEIAFTDNGLGIPYEDQPHIFERFYRVHKDRSRGAGGTGLGLSIVKHIVLAHGGTVTVESVPGQGASFQVRLPAREGV